MFNIHSTTIFIFSQNSLIHFTFLFPQTSITPLKHHRPHRNSLFSSPVIPINIPKKINLIDPIEPVKLAYSSSLTSSLLLDDPYTLPKSIFKKN